MANMMKCSVFKGNKTPPTTYLKNLIVRGGVEAVGDLLRKTSSWDGKEVVCCPIFTLNEGDGTVKASRFSLLGTLNKKVRLLAHNLFTEADKNLVINMTFSDMKIFTFSSKNNSYWIESTDLDEMVITDKSTHSQLTRDEAEERGVQQA